MNYCAHKKSFIENGCSRKMRVVVSNAHWLIKKPDLPQEETRTECRIVPPPRYQDGSWAVVRASELGKVVLWYLVALACRRVPRCHLSIQKQNYILSLIQCQAFWNKYLYSSRSFDPRYTLVYYHRATLFYRAQLFAFSHTICMRVSLKFLNEIE